MATITVDAVWDRLTAALEAGTSQLRDIVQRVIDANPDIVAKARSGKPQVLNVLLGQVMKETRGTADPAEVRGLLEELGLADGA